MFLCTPSLYRTLSLPEEEHQAASLQLLWATTRKIALHLGLPNVMHLTSAWGYSRAAHAAPAHEQQQLQPFPALRSRRWYSQSRVAPCQAGGSLCGLDGSALPHAACRGGHPPNVASAPPRLCPQQSTRFGMAPPDSSFSTSDRLCSGSARELTAANCCRNPAHA